MKVLVNLFHIFIYISFLVETMIMWMLGLILRVQITK